MGKGLLDRGSQHGRSARVTKVSIGMLAMQDGPRSKRGAPSRSSHISSGSDGSGQDAASAALAPLGYFVFLFECLFVVSVGATDIELLGNTVTAATLI